MQGRQQQNTDRREVQDRAAQTFPQIHGLNHGQTNLLKSTKVTDFSSPRSVAFLRSNSGI